MNVYVINLARRTERMDRMRGRLEAASIAFERMDAVDGALLTRAERRAAADSFRWWCAKGYLPRAGEIGCGLSHRNVWRLMLERGNPCGAVLEDDVTLSHEFADVLDAAEKFLFDSNAIRVVLLTPTHEEANWGGCGRFVRVGWGYYTGGYALTAEAARRLLRATSPLRAPIDEWARWVRMAGVELYAAVPAVCFQAEYGSEPWGTPFESDTRERNIVFVRDMSMPRRLLHTACRVVGKTLDSIMTMGFQR